ncbi:hypothetical protein ACHAXA_008559 [Cyclostephanos tholiformis]|uniref:Uncharacterized protein n=1 Tax=Cyclostephanos tholiformis TaxID=382380 RepID=A0ABD3RJQ4_9STRA
MARRDGGVVDGGGRGGRRRRRTTISDVDPGRSSYHGTPSHRPSRDSVDVCDDPAAPPTTTAKNARPGGGGGGGGGGGRRRWTISDDRGTISGVSSSSSSHSAHPPPGTVDAHERFGTLSSRRPSSNLGGVGRGVVGGSSDIANLAMTTTTTTTTDHPPAPVEDDARTGGVGIEDDDDANVVGSSSSSSWGRRGRSMTIVGLASFGLLAAAGAIVASVVTRLRVERNDDPVVERTNAVSSETTASTITWRQQGTTIVGGAAGDEFGSSVAFSDDAGIMAIAAPGYGNDMGYIKVYRIDDDDGKRVVQLGQTIYGDAIGDYFGGSLDITPDGMTVICSSPDWIIYDDRPGYARVFSLEGDGDLGTDNWKQIGQDIVGEAIGDEFGVSVSISDDGKTIAIGANFNDGENGVDSGHVRIYRLVENGSIWEQIGSDIDGDAADDWLGYSVSLSADGSIVAIGAPHNDNNGDNSGQVTVHRFDSEKSSWERLGQSIYGDNALDQLGMYVHLSPDGITLAIGSPSVGGTGYVRVFSLASGDDINADAWNQIGQDIVGEVVGNEFGGSVSLSDDGKTLAVGARDADGKNGVDSGRVTIFRMDDTKSDWIPMGDSIDGDVASDWSGYSVSLSADGNKVAIGSPYNDDNGVDSGHVKVFVFE